MTATARLQAAGIIADDVKHPKGQAWPLQMVRDVAVHARHQVQGLIQQIILPQILRRHRAPVDIVNHQGAGFVV